MPPSENRADFLFRADSKIMSEEKHVGLPINALPDAFDNIFYIAICVLALLVYLLLIQTWTLPRTIEAAYFSHPTEVKNTDINIEPSDSNLKKRNFIDINLKCYFIIKLAKNKFIEDLQTGDKVNLEITARGGGRMNFPLRLLDFENTETSDKENSIYIKFSADATKQCPHSGLWLPGKILLQDENFKLTDLLFRK